MAVKKEYPQEIEIKLALVEWAKAKLLPEDYARFRREIRKDDSITRDEVKALIDAGHRAWVKGKPMVVKAKGKPTSPR